MCACTSRNSVLVLDLSFSDSLFANRAVLGIADVKSIREKD